MTTALTPERLQAEARRLLARRREEAEARSQLDIVDWTERGYYVVDEVIRQPRLIRLAPHQRGVLRCTLQQSPTGRLLYSTAILSTVKKSGKTTLAGIVARFFAEVRAQYGEVYCIGNDFEQARDRAFKSVYDSIRMTPGAIQKSGEWHLPGLWVGQKTNLQCLTTGTFIRPIAVDARGEAGSNPDLSVWTELWGFEYREALEFWNEMTPVPTKPDSMRLVETYAGYDGESNLLRSLHDTCLQGRQLTNHEFALIASRGLTRSALETAHRAQQGAAILGGVSVHTRTAPASSRPADGGDDDTYEGYLGAFEETGGDPEALVPIWVNEQAGALMYWDAGLTARRMPWQRGEAGRRYYETQEAVLPPTAYRRLHLNEWVGAEGEFVPLTVWDTCYDEMVVAFQPDKRTPVVIGVDAASTGDAFAVVAVTRHPDPERHGDPAIRAVRVWNPPSGGRIDFEETENFIRLVCQQYNVVCVVCDPYQLEDMAQRLNRDGIWCERFGQGQPRLKADRQFYDLIMTRRLAHNGDATLREHIGNAASKLEKEQDSKLRIVKRVQNRKIDGAVAASMACYQVLYLLL